MKTTPLAPSLPPPFSPALAAKIAAAQACFVSTTLGPLNLPSRLVLAPMAGYTSYAFRKLMTELGAALTTSELISANAIHYQNARTLQMLQTCGPHDGIQIFGHDREVLRAATILAQARQASFIELNLGCPVRKVAAQKAGAMLMAEPDFVEQIFADLTSTTKLPVSAKMRTGITQDQRNAPEILACAAKHHLAWATLHGRTKAQAYQGKADWDFIEDCAAKAKIPLIGNGDLTHPTQIAEKLTHSKCAALMLGRGALARPFLFLEAYLAWRKKDKDIVFTAADYQEVFGRLAFYINEEHQGQASRIAVLLQKYLMEMSAGFPGASSLRQRLGASGRDPAAITRLGQNYFSDLGTLARR